MSFCYQRTRKADLVLRHHQDTNFSIAAENNQSLFAHRPAERALELTTVISLHATHGSGVDIIENEDSLLVLEVNASPGFETMDSVHGVDVAGEVLKGLTVL